MSEPWIEAYCNWRTAIEPLGKDTDATAFQAGFNAARALDATPAGSEPRGCPTPGACSCPPAPPADVEAALRAWVHRNTPVHGEYFQEHQVASLLATVTALVSTGAGRERDRIDQRCERAEYGPACSEDPNRAPRL